MTDRGTRIQLRKIADALHVPVESVEYLEPLGGEHLAVLRERIVNTLYERYPAEYQRYSRMGRRVPIRVAVPFAIRVLPPRLLGRSLGSELLEGRAEVAMAMLSSIDPEVFCDAAPYINPAAVGLLVDTAPPELMAGVMNELMERKDFGTADLFVDYVTGQLLDPVETTPGAVAPPRGRLRGLLRRLGRKR